MITQDLRNAINNSGNTRNKLLLAIYDVLNSSNTKLPNRKEMMAKLKLCDGLPSNWITMKNEDMRKLYNKKVGG